MLHEVQCVRRFTILGDVNHKIVFLNPIQVLRLIKQLLRVF